MNKIKANARFCFRSDTLENWSSLNPILKAGEFAVVTDGTETEKVKIGDGVTDFNSLGFWKGEKGDKGDYAKVDQYFISTSTNPQSGTAVAEAVSVKQDKLRSGIDIKTVNGQSLLGYGDISVSGGSSLYLNVKDLGAIGDGVTDDTYAIQNAINNANGKTVFFPKGTYLVSNTLNLKSNTNLLGESRNSSILKLSTETDDRPLIKAVGTSTEAISNIVIRELGFTHHEKASSIDSTRIGKRVIISFDYTTLSSVNNCSFYSICGAAILINRTMPLGGSRSIEIKDNTVTNYKFNDGNFGVVLDDRAEYCEISGNRFNNLQVGVYVFDSANNRIVNNSLSSCFSGIICKHTKTTINGGKTLIALNTINHCSRGGILVEELSDASDVTRQAGCIIEGNVILLPNYFGIKVLGGIGHLITGNRIMQLTVGSDYGKGIWLLDNGTGNSLRYVLVTGNSVMHNSMNQPAVIQDDSSNKDKNSIVNNMLVVNS